MGMRQDCDIGKQKSDCLKLGDREWARGLLWRDRPRLLVVLPPCTLFGQFRDSALMIMLPEQCPKQWAEAVLMVLFAVEVCVVQLKACCGFGRAPPDSQRVGPGADSSLSRRPPSTWAVVG